MISDRSKRYSAWLRYKLLSDDLFQSITGKSLENIAEWPFEERIDYHRSLILGLHRNRLCMEARICYKFTYVPENERDENHERAIESARENVKRYQELLADLAWALQQLEQSKPKKMQGGEADLSDAGLEPGPKLATPKPRKGRGRTALKVGDQRSKITASSVEKVLFLCLVPLLFVPLLTSHGVCLKGTKLSVDEEAVIAEFDRELHEEVHALMGIVEGRILAAVEECRRAGLNISENEVEAVIQFMLTEIVCMHFCMTLALAYVALGLSPPAWQCQAIASLTTVSAVSVHVNFGLVDFLNTRRPCQDQCQGQRLISGGQKAVALPAPPKGSQLAHLVSQPCHNSLL